MNDESWPNDWLRGILPMAVMGVLAGGPTYGYAISQSLKDGGVGEIKGGTLYPLLQRLEKDGFVVPQWRQGESGPGRKYFELTQAGIDELEKRRASWQRFARAVQQIAMGDISKEINDGDDHDQQ